MDLFKKNSWLNVNKIKIKIYNTDNTSIDRFKACKSNIFVCCFKIKIKATCTGFVNVNHAYLSDYSNKSSTIIPDTFCLVGLRTALLNFSEWHPAVIHIMI